MTYPKRKARCGVVASPPVRGTLILSASFMFSPPSFVTPVFFPLPFPLRTDEWLCSKRAEDFLGKSPAF